MRFKALRTIFLTLLLAPFFLGIIGTGMHFVPTPSFRWIAVVVAILYCGFLFAVLLKLAPPRTPEVSEKVPASVKVALGIPIIVYFVYVGFYMNVSAIYTQTFGDFVQREYQIESLEKGGVKAALCPYRLKLRGTVTVLNDSFCVDKEFAISHSPGQSIVLTGKQSALGFRFRNAS